MSRPAMVSRVGQWQLCVQSPGVGGVGLGAEEGLQIYAGSSHCNWWEW